MEPEDDLSYEPTKENDEDIPENHQVVFQITASYNSDAHEMEIIEDPCSNNLIVSISLSKRLLMSGTSTPNRDYGISNPDFTAADDGFILSLYKDIIEGNLCQHLILPTDASKQETLQFLLRNFVKMEEIIFTNINALRDIREELSALDL